MKFAHTVKKWRWRQKTITIINHSIFLVHFNDAADIDVDGDE